MNRRVLRALKWTAGIASGLLIIDVVALFTVGIGVIVIQRLDPPTELIAAVGTGHTEYVRELIIGRAANLDEQRGRSAALGLCFVIHCDTSDPRYGDTALMAAVETRSPDLVRLLLDSGADVSLQDSLGQSALDLAAQHVDSEAQKEIFALLLERSGGRVEEHTARSVLIAAAQSADADLARRFLPQVSDQGTLRYALCTAVQRTEYGIIDMVHEKLGEWPATLYACLPDDADLAIQVLQYMLERGFDMNRYDEMYGMTLLSTLVFDLPAVVHHNCSCRLPPDVRVVEFLLEHGADPKAGRHPDASALAQARRLGKTGIVEWFETGHLTVRTDPNGLLSCGEPPPCAS